MQLRLKNPTTIILPECGPEVIDFLTYQDKSVQFMINKLRQNRNKGWVSPEQYEIKMAALKEEMNCCLVTFDLDGNATTHSGLAQDLCAEFGWRMYTLPDASEPRRIPWKNKPEHEARYYQKEAVQALLDAQHGAISLPTGSGKSRVIIDLIKERPCKTIVMAPFTDIVDQLVAELTERFGKSVVGKYKPKKRQDKLITVATVQALTRIMPGTPEYESLLECESVIVDESHTIAAESFKKVCLEGVAKNATNRWFVSATQIRGDGSEKLLRGVTGPIVYSREFMELANQGFLKKLKNHIFTVPTMMVSTTDPKTEVRNNFYRNKHIASVIGRTAAACARSGRPCVILIDEYEQFAVLKPFLDVQFEFAHGNLDQDAKKIIDPEFWKSDNKAIVKRFNEGKTMCLVGTTAISTGVDIKPTATLVNWQGGKSETKIKQGIGRGTRPSTVHPVLALVDFIVSGSKTLEKYAKERVEIYEEFSDQETMYL